MSGTRAASALCLAIAFLPACGEDAPADRAPPADRLAALEADLLALDRHERDHPDDFDDLLARWRAFRADAEGTPCADYAASRIRLVEAARGAAATEELGGIQKGIHLRGGVPTGAQLDELAELATRYPGTTAAEAATRLRERHLGLGTPGAGATIAFAVRFHSGRVDVSEGAAYEGTETLVDAQNHCLRFLRNDLSVARFSWEMPAPGGAAWLVIEGASSMYYEGHSYSPITVRVNDEVVFGDWSTNDINFTIVDWDVTRFLRPGTNRIEIALGNGFSQFWLREIRLEVRPR